MISNNQNDNDLDNDLSLWIDESQVKRFSGKSLILSGIRGKEID